MFAIWIHFCKSCIMLTSIVRKKYLTVTQTELQVATLKQRDRPCIFKLKSTTSVLPCKIARSINKLFCHVLLFQLTEHHFCRCLCLELKEKRITQSCILTLVKPKSGGWGGAWWHQPVQRKGAAPTHNLRIYLLFQINGFMISELLFQI